MQKMSKALSLTVFKANIFAFLNKVLYPEDALREAAKSSCTNGQSSKALPLPPAPIDFNDHRKFFFSLP